MKALIFILFLFSALYAEASECENNDVIQQMQVNFDQKFYDTYQNVARYAHVYCRTKKSCWRASNFGTDDYDGDVDTGRVDTMITSITCTDRQKFGLGAAVPFTTTRNLRTEFNSLMQSGRMPSLTHSEGKNLKESKSPSLSGSRQTTPQNSNSID